MKLLRFTLLLLLSLSSLSLSAQNAEMADAMRSEGKIYVLLAIILIILGGVFLYLVVLDRKLTRLEGRNAEKKPS